MSSDYTINPENLKKILFELLKQINIDPTQVEAQVKKTLAEELIYLPIRHNSPGSAILVKRYIEEYKPKLVLIEGPYLAENLIPYMIEQDTIPPIAILSLFSDVSNTFGMNGIMSPDISVPAKFHVHYPFISYAPELIALKECKKKNIPVKFIDLPLTGIIPYMIREDENFLHFLKQEENQFISSKFYKILSQVFQFDSFHETWDSLFEIGANRADLNDLRESLLIFCACILATIPNKEECLKGSVVREQFMKYCILDYVKKYGVEKSETLVITGGMHSVSIPSVQPKKINFPTKGLFNSLVPFSYFKISDKSGYGSGNQAPQFYNDVWNSIEKDEEYPYEKIALEIITDILRSARLKGNIISLADSINSFHSSKLLAMMRRRTEPSLKDVVDSIYMSIVKGNPIIEGAYLNELLNKRLIGIKVGKVTKKIGRLPLQEDFYLRFEVLGIKLTETIQKFTLNLREDNDQNISYLFWRIKYLGIGILHRRRGPDLLLGVSGVFSEAWDLRWDPIIDVKLIELNNYGSTVEEASKNKMIEEAQKFIKDSEKVSFLLYHTLVMGLPNLFPHLYDICLDSLDKDDSYITLSRCFSNNIMIFRYLSMMESQDYNLDLMKKLINRSYYSSCYALPMFANPPKDNIDEFVIAMRYMATTLISCPGIDITAFRESLKTCIISSVNHFIKGCCVGLLYLINDISITEIKKEIIDYTQSEDSIKINMGEFVRGIVFECRTKILFNIEIIQLLDDIIKNLEWNIFTSVVPSLRKAFTELDNNEYKIFTENIAKIYGLKLTEVTELKDDIEDAYLILFSEIDNKVRKIFQEWFGEM